MSAEIGGVKGGYRIFEVFIQWRAGDEFEHVGEIEAPDHDTALLAAKEHFLRREAATGLWVVDRSDVAVAHWSLDVLTAGSHKRYRRSLAGVDDADILAERI